MSIANGIELTFKELAPELARELLDIYERGAGAHAHPSTIPDPVTGGVMRLVKPQPQPAPTPMAMQPQPAPTPMAMQPQPAQTLVDKDGVPYNPELHAPLDGVSKGLQADGRWKCKRNIQRQRYDDWAAQHAHGTAPAFGFPSDLRAANTVVNGALTVPDEQTVLKRANELAVAGLLTAAESMRIMQLAGTSDHTELVRDPAKRAIAWAELQKLGAVA